MLLKFEKKNLYIILHVTRSEDEKNKMGEYIWCEVDSFTFCYLLFGIVFDISKCANWRKEQLINHHSPKFVFVTAYAVGAVASLNV